FYLIPQMVGAGSLIKPLLGLQDLHIGAATIEAHAVGVISVGAIVTLIVVTAGMVSTTWVQFIKGGMLVIFCTLLTVLILMRGFHVSNVYYLGPITGVPNYPDPSQISPEKLIPESGGWVGKPYVRLRDGHIYAANEIEIWRRLRGDEFGLCQT